MIFRNFCFIFVIGVICVEFSVAYKCSFVKDGYYYTCVVNPDSKLTSEQHVEGLSDVNVNVINFNGILNGVTRLKQTDLAACSRFNEIESLNIFGNLKTIDGSSLRSCKFADDHEIIIKDTEIKQLPEGLFSMHPKVKQMILSGNKMITLPANIFKNQIKLETLDLSNNKISSLPPNIFKSTTALGNLKLNDNNIGDLPKNIFKSQSRFWTLDLSNNRLTAIHSDSFATYETAGLTLGLDGNQIRSFDQRIFDNKVVEQMLMDKNSCCTKTGLISGEEMKISLKKCFDNYRPR